MTPTQRILKVLAGQVPDHPPVSFWHHFPENQWCGEAAVEAHLEHLRTFDLDFLKVMNDNGYPGMGTVQSIHDLRKLDVCRGDEPEFAAQYEVLRKLSERLAGEVLMTTTVFNSFATLRRMVGPIQTHHGPPDLSAAADPRTEKIREFALEDETAVQHALDVISQSLALFSARCLEAGADGIFLSVRDDWLSGPGWTAGSYDRLVRRPDLAILGAAAAGRFNVLHVCGHPVDFDAFSRYPVHAINWEDRVAGPAIDQVIRKIRPAVFAGLDNLHTMPECTAESCAEQAADARRQAGDAPFALCPGCTYDPHKVSAANLHAIVRAARSAAPSK